MTRSASGPDVCLDVGREGPVKDGAAWTSAVCWVPGQRGRGGGGCMGLWGTWRACYM